MRTQTSHEKEHRKDVNKKRRREIDNTSKFIVIIISKKELMTISFFTIKINIKTISFLHNRCYQFFFVKFLKILIISNNFQALLCHFNKDLVKKNLIELHYFF